MEISIKDNFSVATFFQSFEPRYIWKEVNYEWFLYDTQEDLHMPEQIYWQLLSSGYKV